MPTRFTWASAFAVLLCYSTLAAAQTPTFNRIIGTGTPLPPNGSGLVVGGLFNASLLAARDRSSFAFMARNQLQQNGIYRYDNGVISRAAIEIEPTPDGTGILTLFYKPPAISASSLAFVGYGLTNQNQDSLAGIYLVADGSTTEVVNNSTTIAGAPAPFSDFGNIDLNGDTVTFTGIITLPNETRYGVYRYRNSQLLPIVQRENDLPGGGKATSAANNVGGGGGYSAFWASSVLNNVSRSGIYLVDADDQISVVVDTDTTIPGTSQKFLGFYSFQFAADGPDLAFKGGDQAGDVALYRRVSGVLQPVARNGQAAPGGGIFDLKLGLLSRNEGISLDDGHIAFRSAFSAAQNAIYTDAGGPLRRIIATGDMLDGKTITGLW